MVLCAYTHKHTLQDVGTMHACTSSAILLKVHPSVLGMSSPQSIQSMVPIKVSTIYGTLLEVLVYPGMPILDFKNKCFEEDLWDGTPIHLLSPLAINVDVATMMTEGRQVTDPRPWERKGRYNRFRLCTKDCHLLDDEGVLQQDMLTDCKLFKVQWMKQFNFRADEWELIVAIKNSFKTKKHIENVDMAFNHRTSFRAFPFFDDSDSKLFGLVYQHSAFQRHARMDM